MKLQRFTSWLLACTLVTILSGQSLAQAQAGEKVDVLIGFRGGANAEDVALVQAVGAQVKFVYRIIPAIAASVPEAALAGLALDRRVTVIEQDGIVFAIDHTTTAGSAELDNTWGVKHIGSGAVHSGGNSGTGVKVAVIDSGIDYTHPDLSANYAGGYDFVNNDSDPMDDNGHGTHVAGTVAAVADAAGVIGVAPGAALYAVKVLSADGSGAWSGVIAGLDWCVQNGIQISNNSYGSGSDPGSLVQAAFDNAAAAGLLNVAAAGNSGTPPGKGNNVGYPARYDSVVAVAATDQNDKRASFSSTGDTVELAAPGVNINSTLLGGGYGTASGTSMASPHVAGVAALVIGSGITDSNSNGRINDEVRLVLQNTADDLGDAGLDTQYGFGLVDADEAAPAPTTAGTIAGTVTDASTGLPLAGASVGTDTGQTTTTAADGTYSISNVPTGTRSVTASASGYQSETQSVSVLDGQSSTADFALNPIPVGSVAGTVVDSSTSAAISGATVTLDTGETATTDAAGNYSISNVPTGTRTVSASASGYSSASQSVEVAQDTTTTANFALDQVTTATTAIVSSVSYATAGGKNSDKDLYVTVTVVNNLGDPVGGASVSLTLSHDGGSSWAGSGSTDSNGQLTLKLTNAPAGCYTTTVNDVVAAGLTWDGVTPANNFCK